MKEISRRVMTNQSAGMACGPMFIYAVDAEIVVEDEGRKVYLHAQWVDQASDMILFEATTESVYDCEAKLNSLFDEGGDAFEDAICERDQLQQDTDITKVFGPVDINERYAEQYQQLLSMMQEVLNKDDIGFDLFNLDDEDEDYDDEDFDDFDEE